ncbi:ROK family protein [Microbacterium sp. P05]|uniref:ROK family protein n=1 Tax=Microbacterium sp. P05 TaxID=3366948 RepID=UPI003744FE0C
MTDPLLDSDIALAVDIGGTKVEAALVTANGQLVAGSRHRAPTGRERSAEELDASVRTVVESALAAVQPRQRLLGAGVGSAGPVFSPDGEISPLNLPQWRRHRIAERVTALTGLPTVVRLDGQCLALAEAWVGNLVGTRNAMALVVSTGVGSGLIVDGRLLSGGTGNAGHLGQMLIREVAAGQDPDEASVERISSGTGSVAWARANGWEGTTGEELVADSLRGHPTAVAAIQRSVNGLAEAIASVGALVDIEAVSIAGGFALGYPRYIEEVSAALARYNVLEHTTRITVHRSSLGGDAPLIGAGGLVWRA